MSPTRTTRTSAYQRRNEQPYLGFASDGTRTEPLPVLEAVLEPTDIKPELGSTGNHERSPSSKGDHEADGAVPRRPAAESSVAPVETLEFPVDGGSVNFSKLRGIMATTTLKNYLRFAGLDADEIESWEPILLQHGVTHFDLFLFPDYFSKNIFREWKVPHGVAARLLLHAVLYYQYHVLLGA